MSGAAGAPGDARAAPRAAGEVLDFLRGVAGWLAGRVAPDGSAVCPRHRVEHTGKLVYGASLDLALLRAGDDAEPLRERIRRRVLRTLLRARVDPASGATLFFPGSMDPRNAASNLIDSGACCDVLAEVLLALPELFSEAERDELTATLVAVCTGTLAEAVLVKEVPAQRLWGATGLAQVARLTGEARFADAAREALRRAAAQAHPDGSIPYFPDPQRRGEHAGVGDVTTYYHSRHVGFAAWVLAALGEPPEPEVAGFLRRALDVLCALQDRRGLKPLSVEAKQWYWESAYEVASHSFDVHALVAGAGLFGEARFAHAARRALERMLEHAGADGGLLSHRGPGINFQCRDFWNGHVAWVARVLDALPGAPAAEVPPDVPPGVTVFPDAGLVRADRAGYAALLRGAKQPANISFGGAVGGGGLVWFGRRERGFADEIGRPGWDALLPGDWQVTPARRPGAAVRWRAVWEPNRRDVRFRLYIADVERRAGNLRHALGYPWRHVAAKLAAELRWRFAVRHDVAPVLALDGDVASVTARPCRRDGTPLPGAVLRRRYVFGPDALEVEDVLELAEPVAEVRFSVPACARDLELHGPRAWRAAGDLRVLRRPGAPVTLAARYRL